MKENRLANLIFIFFVILFLNPIVVGAQEKIEIYFFWGQGCPHCAAEKPFLEKLKEKYPQLIIKDFEIYYNTDNQRLFQQVAKAYNTEPYGVPTTFIGKEFVVGFGSEETSGKEIENLIQNCLKNYCPSPAEILRAGGIDKWQPPSQEVNQEQKEKFLVESEICIHYFVKDECLQCQNLKEFLEDIARKYKIYFKIYNVSQKENQLLYEKLQEFYKISFAGFPIVFLGDSYLIGDELIRANIEKIIIRCQKEGCPCPINQIKETIKQIPQPGTFLPEEKEKVVLPLFGKKITISIKSSLLFLGIILGLADGINPCMFSVLLFLLSYLLAIGSEKKAIKVGLVFSFSVFVVYFLFMVGIINLISLIGLIGKIKIIVAIVALIAGFIMIKDFFAYGKWVSLEIPQGTKYLIEKLVKKSTIPSAILLAFLSSLVELPCTAGIPLVYTTILAQKKVFYIPYLIWYNLFFITPLLLIIATVTFAWARVERIENWRIALRKYMRLLAGLILIFLSLAILLGWI